MSEENVARPSNQPDDLPVNHAEAVEFAAYRLANSNLARCYMDLRADVDRLRAALEHVRASAQTGHGNGVVISYAAFEAVRSALGGAAETKGDAT